MYIKTPKVLTTVKIKDIPKSSHGTDGKSVVNRKWATLFSRVLCLTPGYALVVSVSNQTSYVSRRLHEVAKRKGFKLKTAVRQNFMYLWLESN